MTSVLQMPGLADLRREVRAFLDAADFTPMVDSWMVGHEAAFTQTLAQRGWVGMTIPKEYGGGGRDYRERYVVIEELLAAGAPIAAHWFADRQVAPALLKHGTESQRRRFLPSIARGELFFAIGLSEHGAGSDLAGLSTAARRVEGGWSLSGTKVWTSWAHRAGAILVLVRTSSEDVKHAGLTQMIVPLPADGLTISPVLTMSGEHHFNELIFDDVFVPDELVLGEVGAGWAQVRNELRFERSGPERFLSTFPLLAEAARRVEDGEEGRVLARLAARLWALRQVSSVVADEISRTGSVPERRTSIVKDLGTEFEIGSIEAVRANFAQAEPSGDGELSRLLREAILSSPGMTLRGGASEVIRGLIAQEVLR